MATSSLIIDHIVTNTPEKISDCGDIHTGTSEKARNEVNIKLRNAKRNYYSMQIAGHKHDPKKAWKSINNLLGKQSEPTGA